MDGVGISIIERPRPLHNHDTPNPTHHPQMRRARKRTCSLHPRHRFELSWVLFLGVYLVFYYCLLEAVFVPPWRDPSWYLGL